MPNPTINPVWAPGATFTVTNSDYLAVDVRLTNIDEAPAVVILTVPAGATVRVVRDPASWSATGVEIRSAGAWIGSPISLGDWLLSVVSTGTVTQPVNVEVDSSVTGASGWLRFIIQPLALAACVVEPGGGNASIDRVLAGPSIINPHVSLPSTPVKELDAVTLAASVQATVQANPMPAAPLPAPPTLVSAWAPESTNALAVSNFTPTGTTATFTAPAAYTNTALAFRFTTAYDLDANAAISVGDPRTEQVLNVPIQTVTHGMVLILDRSGSMAEQLGGGAGAPTKWEAAVRAAHAWLDLFRSLRTGAAHQGGIVTFEHDTCTGTQATATDVTLRNPQTGMEIAGTLMSGLSTLGNIATMNLGPPQTCTPIGDALVKGLDVIKDSLLDATNKATLVLLTDGYENSGQITITGAQTFSSTFNSGTYNGVRTRLGFDDGNGRIFTIGVGQTVDESRLNDVPGTGPSPGFYRMTTNVSEILPTFADMLGHVLDAQRILPTGAVVDPDAPANAIYFDVSTGEQRVLILAPWPNATHSLRVAFRTQGSNGAFTLVNSGDTAVINYLQRDTHGLMTVDLSLATGAAPATATQWRVQLLNNVNAPQPLTDADVLCMVDLLTRAEIVFDRKVYYTGEPIHLHCRIVSGGQRIAGAIVGVDVARPGEGLGTFLATNSGMVIGHPGPDAGGVFNPTFSVAAGGAVATQPKGPDPDRGKGLMFKMLLAAKGIAGLPIVTPPMFHLHDDGAHGDGAANDGDYANTYTDTLKEGTYTFRFRVEGTLPDGSRYSRLFVRSTWVGVKPDPTATTAIWTTVASAPAGMIAYLMSLTPRSATGEYLGPFRGDTISLQVTGGSLDGPLVDRFNGSYEQRVLTRRGDDPVASVDVNGFRLPPIRPDLDTNCWCLFLRLLRCIWRKVFGRLSAHSEL